MFSHFTLPGVWDECANYEICDKVLHFELPPSTLNNYPREWVELLAGNCEITEDYIAFYDENRNLHRATGPAVEHFDGRKEWYVNGKLHRVGGPAVQKPEGAVEWWQHGRLHRLDGPAVEDADGTLLWYADGKRYNENSPAVSSFLNNHYYKLIEIQKRFMKTIKNES